METSWGVRVKNEVLQRVTEERNILMRQLERSLIDWSHLPSITCDWRTHRRDEKRQKKT